MWSFDQLPAFGRSFVSAGRLVSALRFISVWVVLPLGWLLLCLVVSPGEVCAVLTPRSLLFFFSCGDFLFCRFSSNFRDLDYVGENAHDLFTVVLR